MSSLHSLVETVHNISDSYVDSVVPSKNIQFFHTDEETVLKLTPIDKNGSLFGAGPIMQGIPNDHALTQLVSRIDGDPTFSLDTKHFSLAQRSHFLQDLITWRNNANYLIRMRDDGVVRAVLSDQYVPFDAKTLLPMIEHALDEAGWNAEVWRPQTGDTFRAYILDRNLLVGEDGKHPGIYVRDSEIGTGGVRIHGGSFTGACQNGMIYGWQINSQELIRHRWFSENQLQNQVLAALVTAIDMSEEAAKRFAMAYETPVSYDAIRAQTERLQKQYGLSVETKENWLNSVANYSRMRGRASEPMVADWVEAATLTAQSLHVDEREQMERMAGNILSAYTTIVVEDQDDETQSSLF
jgi:hypothetical protein